MYSRGCFPITTKPRRVTENSASLIDHIWTTNLEDNITQTTQEQQNVQQNSHRQFLNNPPDFSFYLYPVRREEVTKYIKTLKPNTASGYDEIPSKRLQDV
ncbi:hypothetical protein SK128_000132 [Halocaridina rubra]|uniref:Uncharacterized protein n=1 Tax=Halocaridina rubra TaxID=373956 RepID=A0AAN8ZXY5_HALRR